MIFIRIGTSFRIGFPMKSMGVTTGWGCDLACADLYVGNDRIFPKNSKLHDSKLVASYHERFWHTADEGFPGNYYVLDNMPQLYCWSIPGRAAPLSRMSAWGAGGTASSTSTYWKYEAGCNLCGPEHSATSSINSVKKIYADDSNVTWVSPWSAGTKNFYTNIIPSNVSYSVVSQSVNGYFLLFNTVNQTKYFRVRPYAILLFKDWELHNITAYFGNSGYYDGTTTLKFGMNMLTAATWSTPFDWHDTYVGAYDFDYTKQILNSRGWLAAHYIITSYTYDGHTYYLVSATIPEKTISASIANPNDYKGDCPPHGIISTPKFNVPYSGNAVDWVETEQVVTYGYRLGVYVLEYGCEYYASE